MQLMTVRRVVASALALGAFACGSADTSTTDAGRDGASTNEGGHAKCPLPEQLLPIAYRPCVDGGPNTGDAGPADASLLCSNDCTSACKQLATTSPSYGTVSSCSDDGPTDAGQAAATCHFIPPCPL
jgi:hypothetical protein